MDAAFYDQLMRGWFLFLALHHCKCVGGFTKLFLPRSCVNWHLSFICASGAIGWIWTFELHHLVHMQRWLILINISFSNWCSAVNVKYQVNILQYLFRECGLPISVWGESEFEEREFFFYKDKPTHLWVTAGEAVMWFRCVWILMSPEFITVIRYTFI